MLQIFLQNCIPAMENAATAMLPLAMLLALSGKVQAGNLKKLIWQGVLWGILGAFFIATVKLGTKNAVKREVFELLVVVVALAGEFLLLASYWLRDKTSSAVKNNKLLQGTTCVVAVTFALYHGLDLFLFPADVYASADTLLSVNVLAKFAGFIVGILLALLTGVAVFRAADALSYKAVLSVFTIQFTAIILKQIILVIQIMMARRILLGGKVLMSVMVPLINHHIWLLYLVLIVTLSLPVALFLQKKPARSEGSNPAQYRKILIAVRKKLRWGTVVTLSILVLFLLSTVGKTYADKAAEIVPAVPVTAQQGQVRIPLEKVEDGHLHRYSFTASTGTVVRFIIIKKGGSAYGVGLDACEICGPTGYFERDDQVVCKLCDVVMNKATIGFKGGCNPIPLEYKVDEGSIIIPAMALEKEKERFM